MRGNFFSVLRMPFAACLRPMPFCRFRKSVLFNIFDHFIVVIKITLYSMQRAVNSTRNASEIHNFIMRFVFVDVVDVKAIGYFSVMVFPHCAVKPFSMGGVVIISRMLVEAILATIENC